MKKSIQSTHLFLAWILSVATLTFSTDPQSICPEKCKCSEGQLAEVGAIYTVNCHDKDMIVVPELTNLSKISLPIYLNLGRNKIQSISNIDFPTGLNIIRLDLDKNSELVISDDAFMNLAPTLKRLTLDAVGLPFHKPLTMLSSLGNLEELSISHNNKMGYVTHAVKDIDSVLFKNDWPITQSLKILRMSYCGIRSLSPETLDSLIALRELDLSNNWLVEVPSAVKYLNELRKLSLFHCKIDTLDEYTFLGLSNLEVIELTTNPLKTIKRNAFSGLEKTLTKLRLDICHLQQIPSEAIKDLTMLEYIDLSQNSFSSAPATSFVGKYCVKELLVSSEGLIFEPLTFSGQSTCVTDLTIKQMKLKAVPREALAQLNKLVRLSLEYNEITELPKNAFSDITATTISLANNPLYKIDAGAFLGLPAHLNLNLRRTKVADIEFLLGYPDDAIDMVNLDYAELTCTCSMKSALNATLNVEIHGSCIKGIIPIPLSSSTLEGILDKICMEEQAFDAGHISGLNMVMYFALLSLHGWKILT